MSQLLSGKQKGRFAAPPEPSAQRSPWAYIPIIVLLPVTMIFVVITSVTWTTYYNCGDSSNFSNPGCVGAGLRPVENGTMGGVVGFTGALLVLAFVVAILAAVRMKTWPVWLCWGLAVAACAVAVGAFLVLNGVLPTPFGVLVELPPPDRPGG